MPHKRAKRSTREQKRSQDGHDNVPAKSVLSNEAIPKGAARVLNAWKVQEEFRKKRKLGSADHFCESAHYLLDARAVLPAEKPRNASRDFPPLGRSSSDAYPRPPTHSGFYAHLP
ncbi:hypothetical protein BDY19DRAFT_1047362 [Irpex rosettiformis]|uniref:Uncharacterized protein n=1 Tax=Irpex rosettiformis TaxID=378272 RepID=A0ACB8U7B3_9APHY|nr:hypothetical protein BDY19DRAFT_1047362 [Irpex rosettiformis]